MKNQNAPRPSEHPPVRGEKMSKRCLNEYFLVKECHMFCILSWYLAATFHLRSICLDHQEAHQDVRSLVYTCIAHSG